MKIKVVFMLNKLPLIRHIQEDLTLILELIMDGFLKGINFPKVELRNFDGTNVFTWVNQIEKYFELHNIMDDKKIISLETLYFETNPYQWYQWVVKRKPHSYNYTWGLFTRDLEAKYGKVWEQDYF
jgi:hypothetical protein